MSTIEADTTTGHDDQGHDHDHPSFLAHHFDTPEQQFDSGKLGIWLFLVTEILFFGGMFCAYSIFRALRPDVFEGCSQFLNTKLGAINTGVLLFSSLTMAWAVRCAQTENHKGLTAMLAATLSCAMVFLGVKAIEYSHKWGMGLLPPRWFFYGVENQHPTAEQLEQQYQFSETASYFLTNSLYFICFPFALALIGVVIWFLVSIARGNQLHIKCAMPLIVVCLMFFAGVGLGTILESGGAEGHEGEHHVASHEGEHGIQHVDADHADADHVETDHSDAEHGELAEDQAHVASSEIAVAVSSDYAVLERLAQDQTNSGLQSELEAIQRQASVAGGGIVTSPDQISGAISEVEQNVLTPKKAGVFFSIYYCMTGIHAIHILGGIGVLVWLLIRSVRHDFNRQYFGPVDYVGLYWHLVDLIWIYLFPLLYLIR